MVKHAADLLGRLGHVETSSVEVGILTHTGISTPSNAERSPLILHIMRPVMDPSCHANKPLFIKRHQSFSVECRSQFRVRKHCYTEKRDDFVHDGENRRLGFAEGDNAGLFVVSSSKVALGKHVT